MTSPDTRQTILSVARKMVQSRGFSALSFRDIAASVGVKSASVHYHFPTKGSLGSELARGYTDEMAAYLAEALDENADTAAFMTKYVGVFRAALVNDNRMCMCGVMAAERDELPAEVQAEVERFSEVNVEWLAKALERHDASVPVAARKARALAIFAAVEGAQLIARSRSDVGVYDQAIGAMRVAGLIP
ncbi:TetR family transcriptional regulator [Luteibacter sp. OK325]|uniref:TetR/AcrR family transcriptional regulator n=1 Tax=Luteibacter sp. OK325 TaxID=2135670 RepID=UPI000D35F41A|nr:TetR/AcrR family transcriptional regulator [Luteibacter sp. OK325]PTR33907.1 TetR family transcriptional regulator [Luteibacter sp. OK325]